MGISGVAGALRLSDGTVVVGVCSRNELRFFDAGGRFLRAVGRAGDGPGEFRYLRRMFLSGGDTVGVFDGVPSFRVSFFSPSGAHLSGFRAPPRLEVMGRFSDGTLIARRIQLPPGDAPVSRGSITLYRLNPNGQIRDSLTGLRGLETAPAPRGGRRPVRLARKGVVAIVGDHVVFGSQETADLIEYDKNLVESGRIVTTSKPNALSTSHKRLWEAKEKELVPLGGVIASFSEEYAPALPAYRDIVAGSNGDVWVQDPERPGVYPLIWTLYSRGRSAGRVQLPPRFFPTQFGSDWVIGVSTDSLGVEKVIVYNLVQGRHNTGVMSPRMAQPPDQPRCGAWTSR